MIDGSYLITPVLAWFVAGGLKFLINSVKAKQLAFGLIGYGGFPSNHSAIVSSTAAIVAFREGVAHPAFGVALTLALIVMMDANSLRRQIGKQAAALNRLTASLPSAALSPSSADQVLRERIGHSRFEIAGGITVGIAVAAIVKTACG